MTAEIKQFSDPEALAKYVQDLYTAGATSIKVTVLSKSVYLIQDETTP